MNPLDQIAETADALTEPHLHREPIHYWDTNRHRKLRHHITVLPGLLAQLYQSVIPASSSAEPHAGGVPGSRPPLAVEALSRHDEIAMAVLRWCRQLDLEPRVSVDSNVRALVGAAGRLDGDDQKELLREMRRWRGWCSVMAGWENVFNPAGATCPRPGCGRTSTLRINLTAKTALCRACGTTWSDEDGSIGVLARHIEFGSTGVAV